MMRAQAMQPMDQAAASGRLALQRCEACGVRQYPPREICGTCLSDALAWDIVENASGDLLASASLQHSFLPETPLPQRVGLVRVGEVSLVCFVTGNAIGGPVTVTAALDASGRAVLTAC